MTQEDLAEFSSLSVNFISKIKRTGNQNISIQKLDAIAKALQTSLITLIDESSKTPEPQAFASKLSNDRVFLDKLTNDMKKLPVEQEEALTKSFITIINIYNGFNATDKSYITLLKSFKATKIQIFTKVILPSNYVNIIKSF